uniref:Uncharacterized protein n=1 Tax=Vitis vinifera TaxID=29760 RepID=A5BGM6_VITVI|nr:hypothetical protein VITISV_027924 [Vitis vinifera]
MATEEEKEKKKKKEKEKKEGVPGRRRVRRPRSTLRTYAARRCMGRLIPVL